MKFVRGNHRSGELRDDGFSLVEVIVAIAIISVVALATASLTINGVALASSTERQQVAVTIANGAMETASAQAVASISSGRTAAAVHTAFLSNSTVPGIAKVAGVAPTKEMSDPSATGSSVAALPITAAPITQSGTKYTTTTLIGSCTQPRAGGDCTAQTPVPAGNIPLIRVVVVVRWTAGKTCAAGGCFYSATTLIDPGKDLEWVTNG